MGPGKHLVDDLVLERLVADAGGEPPLVDSVDSGMARVAATSVPTNVNTPRHLLRRPGSAAAASLSEQLLLYDGLITGGMAALVDLHVRPQREVVASDGRTLLLRATKTQGNTVVVLSALWETERFQHGAPRDARLVELDEFRGVRELPRLENLLTAWSRRLAFVPAHPKLRVAAVATPGPLAALDGVEEQFRAVAAVHGAELDFFPATHDLRDAKAHTQLERALLSSRYRLLVTLSAPADAWVWRMGRRFVTPWRSFRALPVTSAEDAGAELASIVAITAAALPERPTRYWGLDALKRAESRANEAFALSDQAKRHLVRNRYPNPEKMLDHLELLADCAEAWHDELDREEASNQRIEDWAKRKFGLHLALHDKAIRDRDARFDFEGQRLDNRPHVKVDDYVPASECGRIYFAIDDRPAEGVRRLVVDHIGLHDRS